MKLKRITVDNAVVGNWIPLNRMSRDNVGIVVSAHASAGGTYDVNFTESALNSRGVPSTFSRTTTVLTVTLVNHGLTTADNVMIQDSDYVGQHDIASVVDDDSFTVTVADAGQNSTNGLIVPVIVSTLTGFSAATGRVDGLIDASVVAVRLNCTNSTGGPHDISINQY